MGQPGRRSDREGLSDELAGGALDPGALPGNSAKIRLLLDLVELRPARVLDVGCGDLSLWEAVRERPDVVGVDLAVDRSRAAELGIEVRVADARELPFHDDFDAVVSTQVLDDLRDWPRALAAMRDALRPGGTLLLTCDSGDTPRPWRARLRRVPPGPRLEELGRCALELGLEVASLRRYGLRDLKRLQGRADARGRLLTLELEEALEPADPRLWGLLYLRATRPAAR